MLLHLVNLCMRDVLVGGIAPIIGSAIGYQPKILVLAISKMYINSDVKL